jgi:hypothetical protein
LGEDYLVKYKQLQRLNPELIKEYTESKEASTKSQASVRLAIAHGERAEALARDPNWKGNDDLNDPKSPFNLKNLRESLTKQSREFCYQFDANGELVSWSKGNKGQVASFSLPGQMKGGTDIHNHPSDAASPYGWTFSDNDFMSYARSGVAVGIVFSREGEYRLDLPESYSKLSTSKLAEELADYSVKNSAIQYAAQKMLVSVIQAYPNVGLDKLESSVAKVAGKLMLASTEDLCAKIGVNFTFTPNKGYETWKPLRMDGAAENDKDFKENIANPSPLHTIVNHRIPHMKAFAKKG